MWCRPALVVAGWVGFCRKCRKKFPAAFFLAGWGILLVLAVSRWGGAA